MCAPGGHSREATALAAIACGRHLAAAARVGVGHATQVAEAVRGAVDPAREHLAVVSSE